MEMLTQLPASNHVPASRKRSGSLDIGISPLAVPATTYATIVLVEGSTCV
jgi:hypothetical protein